MLYAYDARWVAANGSVMLVIHANMTYVDVLEFEIVLGNNDKTYLQYNAHSSGLPLE